VEVTATTGTEADAMRAADAACYQAKRSGRNCVHVARLDDQSAAAERTDWAGRITRGLEQSRFRLSVQPILPLRPDVSPPELWEMFLRLEEDGGVMLPAAAFLPAAERYSLMSVIDRWVIQHTMARVAGWHPAEGRPQLPLCCINLGDSSLGDEALIALIGQQLAQHRLAPESLCFEIGEPAVLGDLARAVTFTRGLRALGCRVALDDFAGGLASLHHLKALSIDFLKLSASITRGLQADALQAVVARAACDAAGVLGIPIIAKGADTPETLAALRAVGVHYAQGFSLAPPRPIEELIAEAGASCPIV
jgi:EAL domain-containing protein (putative c-di-GMP-specific phosphodiesterase class I)